MKSDQGTIITMIIFILLSFLFMFLTWFFWNSSTKVTQELATATSKVSELEGSLRSANGDVETLKLLIGAPATAAIADMETRNKEYTMVIDKVRDTTKGYTTLLDQAMKNHDNARKELDVATKTNQALEDEYNKLDDRIKKVIEGYESGVAAAKKDLEKEREKYADSMKQRDAVKKTLDEEYKRIDLNAKEAIEQVKMEKAIAEQNVKTISAANESLTKELDGLRSPTLEQEDGRVVSVNQLNGVVTLDIGSASGLRNGTTFAVFDPAEKNLAEARSKGSIEISQILSPNRAEGRILETVITDPIQKGDLIHTPVWKPGMHPRFVLSGRMVVPGFGSRSLDDTSREDDLKDVINLILANGGIVDYYMKGDGTVMKVDTRIDSKGIVQILGESRVDLHVVGDGAAKSEGGAEIAQETSYLIIGRGDSLNNTLMSNMRILDDQARLHGVRSITLPELLRRMGWRSATPSQGYGKRANESDIAARPSKPMPVSNGSAVASLYTQQAEVTKTLSSGTVSPLYRNDGTVSKPSVGTVSPLYHSERKPVKAANGAVSGIYGGN